jgi:hypothetical protein
MNLAPLSIIRNLRNIRNLTIITSMLLLVSAAAQAELKRDGIVLETSCAINQQSPSEISKVCFAQVIGLPGEFITTRAIDGGTLVWMIGHETLGSLNVISLGTIQNRFLVLNANANLETLYGTINQITSTVDGGVQVDGNLGTQPVLASEFESYLHTMGQTDLSL